MNQLEFEKIKKIIEEFFQKTTFDVEIDFLPIKILEKLAEKSFSGKEKTITLPLNLRSDDPQILIGERGQTLMEIQHLLNILLRRRIKTENSFFIDLDINDYKKKKSQYLKELSHSLANEVALTKKEKILPPMPAYERRIIHLELAERTDVVTESIGQEPERKVVIRPYP